SDLALELLSKDHALSADDLALGVELARLLQRLPQLTGGAQPQGESPLLRLSRDGETALELPRHTYAALDCAFAGQRAAYLRLFREGRLAGDERLLFDGWTLTPADRSQLNNWRRRSVAVVGRGVPFRLPAAGQREADLSPEEAARLMGFAALDREALLRLARRPMQTADDESDALRARFALLLLRRPPLLVFDAFGCAPETVREVCAYLRLLCYDKLAAVLVLQGAEMDRPGKR
ncbi:MAG: hypothetical protein PHY12_09335, partial [Eubacteriales bacterium]|nr:hypothetical protein [Eubacteriales bacterium]